MRRFGRALLFGFVWFLIFWQGSLFIGGAIVGARAGAKAKTAKEGAALGEEAGEKLAAEYGVYFLLGAAALAVIGSATGILPWTKPKKNPVPAGAQFQYPPQAPYHYPPQAPYHYPPPGPQPPPQHPSQPQPPPPPQA